MKYIFDILRRQSPDAAPYHQRILFETDDRKETVATALLKINRAKEYLDVDGRQVEEIAWEAGCLQKRCGACAMLINRIPALACDTFLAAKPTGAKNKWKNKKDGRGVPVIFLEPLHKFPVVKDLLTDRSILFENLKIMRQWSGESGEIKEKNLDMAYEASRCLQCGCCLEACPNYSPGEHQFFGAAAYAPQARLISTYTDDEQKMLRRIYVKHVYDGCGKALSCMKVCPAQLDLDYLLSRSNAISVWRAK